jgi:integrase/recombinase XerD
METRFEQFIRERQYLANVTPATVEWYRNSLKWLRTDWPSQADLRDAVLRMREKGLKQFRDSGAQLLRTLGQRRL